MGITGLLPFITDPLKGAIKTVSLREFKGQTAAIDGYVLLHRGAFSCAKQLFEGKDTDVFVSHCMRYIDLLQKHGIRPLLVFDGAFLAAKRETERQRRDVRKTARKQAEELLAVGKTSDAYQAMTRSINITHEMALRFIQAARKRGIDSIVAPYEADAQLAHLNRTGIANFIITEDSDLIVFGCEKILFKLQLTGEGRFYQKSLLEGALCTKKVRCNNYSFDKFRIACILSGCDYIKSLPGIGLAKAWKFASITDSLEDLDFKLPKMAQYLNINGLDVSEEYIRQVKIANGAFKHQVVYDPVEKRRKPLEGFHENNSSCVITAETVGQVEMNAEESYNRALGNIDPMSGAELDNYRPEDHAINKSSIWNTNRLLQSSLITNFVAIQNDSLKSRFIVSAMTPKEESTSVSREELEAQDTRLTTLLQQYVKTDTKMGSTVKECYYKELYEGQNDHKEMNTNLDKEILARNPFIIKNQGGIETSPKNKLKASEGYVIEEKHVTEHPVTKIDTNEEKEDLILQNNVFMSSLTSNKSLQSVRKLHDIKNRKTEKCPFKKQRNNKYDQLLVQKRKAAENGYFSYITKKSKLECQNSKSLDRQDCLEIDLTEDTEIDFPGKENNIPDDNDSTIDNSLFQNDLESNSYANTKSDFILKEINSNMENISTVDPENIEDEKFNDEEVLDDLNLDHFPDKDIVVNKELDALCKEVDTISVQSRQSDELISMDQMLECMLSTNDDDPGIEIEQNSPGIKRHKKNVVPLAKKAKTLFPKHKTQTTLLSFLKKI